MRRIKFGILSMIGWLSVIFAVAVFLFVFTISAFPQLSYEKVVMNEGCIEDICIGESSEFIVDELISLPLGSAGKIYARTHPYGQSGNSVIVPQRREFLKHYAENSNQNWLIIQDISLGRRHFWSVMVQDDKVIEIVRVTYGPFYIDL